MILSCFHSLLKGWFLLNALSCHKLGNLNWVWLLQNVQGYILLCTKSSITRIAANNDNCNFWHAVILIEPTREKPNHIAWLAVHPLVGMAICCNGYSNENIKTMTAIPITAIKVGRMVRDK